MSTEAQIKALGARVRAQRKSLGLTQELLADLSGCGVVFIAHLEAGKPTVRLGKVIDVLSALGMTLEAREP